MSHHDTASTDKASQRTNPTTRQIMSNALLEIKQLKAQVKQFESEKTEPIALVGMACRFPGGANSPQAYWELLKHGKDAICNVPNDRWDNDSLFSDDVNAAGKICTREGGFIDDVAGFDASFFGISPREAESLDPHQRILLEVCWQALEYGNISPKALYGSQSGVFIGVSSLDNVLRLMGESPLKSIGAYHGSGCAFAPIAGRVSYSFGFTGPSFVVDTACSSSLLSLHLAAQSLRRKECSLALAGGVHLIFHPGYSVAFSKAKMLAPDGRCKTFDAAANGYVRGEGCGVVVLKRLSDAQRDGDHVLALLRGSAVNQDGASGGLTVPSGPSQEQVIRQALANGNLDANQVNYIEAHGTGTALGDPIELGALANVFAAKKKLYVGSVKTNIGHLEASAGIASVIKVVLALQNKTIPPHLNLQQPNPLVPWDQIPIEIPRKATPWQVTQTESRIAGISSFGFSGTNVHLVVSEAPEPVASTPSAEDAADSPPSSIPPLLTLSARSEKALRALVQQWLAGPLDAGRLNPSDPSSPSSQSDPLNQADPLDSSGMSAILGASAGQAPSAFSQDCASALVARTAFPHRLSVVATQAEETQQALTAYVAHGDSEGVQLGCADQESNQVAWLFSGQGSQYPGMGQALYAQEPVFRAALAQCDVLLKPSGLHLIELLFEQGGDLDQTGHTQPVLFALEYALAKQWQAWGVTPDVLLGHSVGEYVAACLAGVFTLEDGLKLIAARGRLMQALPAGGGMAAIFTDLQRVEKVLSGPDQQRYKNLNIAAINGARNIVVSGANTEIDGLVDYFESQRIKCRRLNVSHGFHSPLMEPMLEAFSVVAQSIAYHPPKIPVISNLSGEEITTESALKMDNADYWVAHVGATVRFSDSVHCAIARGCNLFLELGPSATLVGMIRQTIETDDVHCFASLAKDQQARRHLAKTLGQYWCAGGEVNWSGLGIKPRTGLPTYPFQHQDFWPEVAIDGVTKDASMKGIEQLTHPLLDRELQSPLLKETVFETAFGLEQRPFLEDHRVFDRVVVAGACHLSLILAAAQRVYKTPFCLTNVLFPQALVVPEEGEQTVQLMIAPEATAANQQAQFRLVSVRNESAPQGGIKELALHAKGELHALAAYPSSPHQHDLPQASSEQVLDDPINQATIQNLRQQCSEALPVAQVYALQRQRHIDVGPSYHWLQRLWKGEMQTLARLQAPEILHRVVDQYTLHPGLIDCCFGALVMAHPLSVKESFIPFAVEQLTLGSHWQQALKKGALVAHSTVRVANESRLVGDIQLYTEAGQLVASLVGIEGRRASRQGLLHGNQSSSPDYYQVQWQPLKVKEALPSGRYLVFADSETACLAIETMRQQGLAVCHAEPSESSGGVKELVAKQHYQVATSGRDALQELFARCGTVDYVIFAWGIDSVIENNATNVPMAHYLTKVGDSALQLMKVFGEQAGGNKRLYLVTRGCQALPVVDGGDAAMQQVQAPHQALLWGLGRVADREYPDLRCTNLDLDPCGAQVPALQLKSTRLESTSLESSSSESTSSESAEALRMLLASAEEERQLAVRNHQPYAARLARVTPLIESPAAAKALSPSQTDNVLTLDPQRCCVISGGGGALGQQLVNWLRQQGLQQIALLSRRAPDTFSLKEADVQAYACDVTNAEDVATAFAQIEAKQGPVGAVFHLAAVLEDHLIENLTADSFAKVWQAKATGGWHLHQQCKDHANPVPLILFASASGLLGTPGQGNYAAANACLDSLAHYRRGQGLPCLSIDWGPWQGDGMAAEMSAAETQRLAAQGITGMQQTAAFTALGKLIHCQAVQVGVMAMDWAQYGSQVKDPFLEQLIPKVTLQPQQLLQKLQTAEEAQRLTLLCGELATRVAEVLRLESTANQPDIGYRVPLFDLGIDSLTALELKNRLQQQLEIKLSATLLFDYPTIESLAAYLLDELRSQLSPPDPQVSDQGGQSDIDVDENRTVQTKIDALSEAEAEALLLQQIESIELTSEADAEAEPEQGASSL